MTRRLLALLVLIIMIGGTTLAVITIFNSLTKPMDYSNEQPFHVDTLNNIQLSQPGSLLLVSKDIFTIYQRGGESYTAVFNNDIYEIDDLKLAPGTWFIVSGDIVEITQHSGGEITWYASLNQKQVIFAQVILGALIIWGIIGWIAGKILGF